MNKDKYFSQEGETIADTPEQMRALGSQLGSILKPGTVVVLTGPLGAGKTTLVQGIAEGLGVQGRVSSPTFTLARQHKPGKSGIGLVHMDAYRLLGDNVDSANSIHPDRVYDALDSLDIDTDLEDMAVVAEWGRGVVEVLSDRVIDIEISRSSEELSLDSLEDEDPRRVHWAFTWDPSAES